MELIIRNDGKRHFTFFIVFRDQDLAIRLYSRARPAVSGIEALELMLCNKSHYKYDWNS